MATQDEPENRQTQMADDGVQDETAGDVPPKRGRLGVMVAVIGASLVGAVGGVVVVGPMAAERLTAAPAAAEGEAKPESEKGAGLETYTVESLVLNPAGTQGTRFLMASVVASVKGEHAAETLTERDAEIRDRLMALLGSKTVDELTDVAGRADLKEEIRSALETLVEGDHVEVRAVYLPTFVVQ